MPAENKFESYKRPPGVTTLLEWGQLKFPDGVYKEKDFVTVLVDDPEYCRRVASRKARSAWLKSFQQYMIAVRNAKSVTLGRQRLKAEEEAAASAAAASAAAASAAKAKTKAKALASKVEEDNWAFIPSQPSTPLPRRHCLVPRIPLSDKDWRWGWQIFGATCDFRHLTAYGCIYDILLITWSWYWPLATICSKFLQGYGEDGQSHLIYFDIDRWTRLI